MIISKIDKYSDGGTINIITDKGDYCIDNRLFSTTKHKIYRGYPLDDNSNMIIGREYNLKWSIWNSLRYFETPENHYCYKQQIFETLSI